jgi:hypothetical protein
MLNIEDLIQKYLSGAERAAEDAYEAQLRAEGAQMVLREILADLKADQPGDEA